MDNENISKASVTFWVILFPKSSSTIADILIPSSPYHLAASLEFGEFKLKDIHSFHADENQAIDLAEELMKSSVNYYLGIVEDI